MAKLKGPDSLAEKSTGIFSLESARESHTLRESEKCHCMSARHECLVIWRAAEDPEAVVGWNSPGQEMHWSEHPRIGVKGLKWAGELDPF